MSLMTLRLAALGAVLPLLVAYVDAPWRTFGQRYVAHRWPEYLVLFSIELNLLLLWAFAKLLVGRDAAVAPDSLGTALVALGLGLAIAWDSWVTVGFALIYVVPFWMHTAIEEQMLAAHFGEAWREYCARVPRIVPGWKAG